MMADGAQRAGFTVTGHTHLAPTGYTGVTAFRRNFGDMPTRGRARIDGRVLGAECAGYIVWPTNADIYISHLEISVDSPTPDFRPFVLSNSKVVIENLVINGMPSGETAPIFRLTDSLSSVHVRNLVVPTPN